MPVPTYLHVGSFDAATSGFFNLNERLASVRNASNLTLPLAPRPIWMPEYPSVNATVSTLVARSEAYVRNYFISVFRSACRERDDFLFADSGSNEGTWSLLAAAHGCRVVSIDPQPLCIALLRAAAESTAT